MPSPDVLQANDIPNRIEQTHQEVRSQLASAMNSLNTLEGFPGKESPKRRAAMDLLDAAHRLLSQNSQELAGKPVPKDYMEDVVNDIKKALEALGQKI